MNKLFCSALVFSLAFGGMAMAHEHGAHQHGAAKLNISIEGQKIDIELESPLANLIPFEHTPKTEQDKKTVRQMAEKLNKAENLFIFPTEAGCTVNEVSLSSEKIPADLLGGSASNKSEKASEHEEHADEGHGDLDADFSFSCKHPEKIKEIDVHLFEEFSGFHDVDVQLSAEKVQKSIELTEKNTTITW